MSNYEDLTPDEKRLRSFIEAKPYLELNKAIEYLYIMRNSMFNPEIAIELLDYSKENSLEDEDLLLKSCPKFKGNIPYIMKRWEVKDNPENFHKTIEDTIDYYFKWLLFDNYVSAIDNFEFIEDVDANTFFNNFKIHPYIITHKGLDLLNSKFDNAIDTLKPLCACVANYVPRRHVFRRTRSYTDGKYCPYCEERPCQCSDRYN